MANNSYLPWLIILIPAIAALIEALLGKKRPQSSGIFTILGSVITFGLAIFMAFLVVHGQRLVAWNGQLLVDGLGALMLVIVSAVGLAASIFSYRYIRHDVEAGKTKLERLPLYFALVSTFICTMIWAVVTNNIIMLFVVVEARLR